MFRKYFQPILQSAIKLTHAVNWLLETDINCNRMRFLQFRLFRQDFQKEIRNGTGSLSEFIFNGRGKEDLKIAFDFEWLKGIKL